MMHAWIKRPTNAESKRLPEPASCEAALVAVVVDCTTELAALELEAVVALATRLGDGGPLRDSVAELYVAFRDMVVPVPKLVAVLRLVMFAERVAVAFDVGVAVDAMLDDPVPPTRERSPE
jgi:hypothetical protein